MERVEVARRRRVSRREAAKILGTSYENVRRMQRKHILNGVPDERGHFWLDRQEVESVAKKRNAKGGSPDGELTARVFEMIKAGKALTEIVIVTRQEFPTIQRIWDTYHRSSGGKGKQIADGRESQAQREHDEQMRAWDADLESRRRRHLPLDEEPPPSHRDDPKKGPRK